MSNMNGALDFMTIQGVHIDFKQVGSAYYSAKQFDNGLLSDEATLSICFVNRPTVHISTTCQIAQMLLDQLYYHKHKK